MKNKLILSLVVLMVALSVLAVSAEDSTTVDDVVSESVSDDNVLSIDNSDAAVYQDGEDSGNVKHVWIDQTVDNSMVYINGELRVIGPSGSTLLVLPLSNSTHAKFSTIDSDARNLEIQTVNNAINYAKESLNLKSIKFVQGTSTNTTRVYDHRIYDTIEEGDAQLIGDVDYLEGAYGLTDTVTHIASGDYGRIMNLTLNYVGEADYDETEDEPAQPAEVDTQNNTTADNATNTTNNTNIKNTTDNSTNNVNANDKNVTNNTHIKPKDVAKATGIPFAVLIVALLGIGVSIRRRK